MRNKALEAKLIASGRITPEQLAPVCKRENKYKAVRTPDSEGRVHPSKLQARITDRLRHMYDVVIPEVSIPLSERKGDRIRIDALCINLSTPTLCGQIADAEFIEIKGMDTPTGVQKRRRFEDRYGIKIRVVKSEKDL